ncbi:hypothetical protein BC332_27865 [Capsicum chinense]|nr:hypothetical protein BC332_27865 [Capsicum chinense]
MWQRLIGIGFDWDATPLDEFGLPRLIRIRMVKSAKESIKRQASNSEIFVNMQAAFIEIDSSPDTTVAKKLEHLKEAVMRSTEKNGDKAEVTFDTIGESIVGSSI